MLDLHLMHFAIVLASACQGISSHFDRVLQGLSFIMLQPLQLLGSTYICEDAPGRICEPSFMFRVELFGLQSRLELVFTWQRGTLAISHPLRLDKGDKVQHTFADASPKYTSNQCDDHPSTYKWGNFLGSKSKIGFCSHPCTPSQAKRNETEKGKDNDDENENETNEQTNEKDLRQPLGD